MSFEQRAQRRLEKKQAREARRRLPEQRQAKKKAASLKTQVNAYVDGERGSLNQRLPLPSVPGTPGSATSLAALANTPTETGKPNPPPLLPSRENAKIKKLKLQPEFQKRLEDTLIRVHIMQETENGRKYLVFCENFWEKLLSGDFNELVWDYFCRGLKWSQEAAVAFCKKCGENPTAVLGVMVLGFAYNLYGLVVVGAKATREFVKTKVQYAYNQTIFVAGTAVDASIVAVNYVKTAVTWFFRNVIFKIIEKLTGLVGKLLLEEYNKIVGEWAALPAAPTEEEGPTAQDHIESALSEHNVDWEEDPDEVYGKILNKVNEVIEENGVTTVNAEVRLQEKIKEANKRLEIGYAVADTELRLYIDSGKGGRTTLQNLADQIKEDRKLFASNKEYEGNKWSIFSTDSRFEVDKVLDIMGERLEQIDSIKEAQMDLKSYTKKFNLLKQNPQQGVDGLLKEHDMLSEMSNKLAGLWNSPAVKLLRENVLIPKSASEIFVTHFGKLIVATVTAQQAVLAGLLQHYEKKVERTKQTKKKSKHEKFKAKLEQLKKLSEELKTQQRELSIDPRVQIEFMTRKNVQPRTFVSIDYSHGQGESSGGASSGIPAIAAPVVADPHTTPLQRHMRVDYTSAATNLVRVKYEAEECEEEEKPKEPISFP